MMRPPLDGVLGMGPRPGEAPKDGAVPIWSGGVAASTGRGRALWPGVPGGFRAFSLCTSMGPAIIIHHLIPADKTFYPVQDAFDDC